MRKASKARWTGRLVIAYFLAARASGVLVHAVNVATYGAEQVALDEQRWAADAHMVLPAWLALTELAIKIVLWFVDPINLALFAFFAAVVRFIDTLIMYALEAPGPNG